MKTLEKNNIADALRLFAWIFAYEADQSMLDEVLSRESQMREVFGGNPAEGLPERKAAHSPLESLAVEFCRLFIGPVGHLPPVESVVCGEGQYWGPSTEAVADFYRSIHFVSSAKAHLFPDHLSMELDCLAMLEEEGRSDLAKTFARKHIIRWLPALNKHIAENALLPFYQVWGNGLQTMLEELYGKALECELDGRKGML